MFWTIFRMVAYGTGVVGAAMLAGRLFSIKHILARLWAISQIVWMFICSVLLIMLTRAALQPKVGVSREIPMVIVSMLLAACPLIIYIRWGRNGDLEK